jgi:hypothetical protein
MTLLSGSQGSSNHLLMVLPALGDPEMLLFSIEIGKPFLKEIQMYAVDLSADGFGLGAIYGIRVEANGNTIAPQNNQGAARYLPLMFREHTYIINREIIGPPYIVNVYGICLHDPWASDCVVYATYEAYYSKASRVRLVGPDGRSPGSGYPQDPFREYYPG